jgi:hypothetical protein
VQGQPDAVKAGRARVHEEAIASIGPLRVNAGRRRGEVLRVSSGGFSTTRGGYHPGMPTLMQKIMRLLNSPAGRRAVEHGRRELSKPANQEKLRRLASRVTSGNKRH